MSELVVSADAAQEEIVSICQVTGATLSEPDRKVVSRAIQEGRLTFDAEKETFSYRLKKPVERKAGNITEITIKEPNAGQIRDASAGKRDDVETSLHLLSLATGQNLVIIEELKQRDLTVLGTILAFFG